jgi:hypothetical protein
MSEEITNEFEEEEDHEGVYSISETFSRVIFEKLETIVDMEHQCCGARKVKILHPKVQDMTEMPPSTRVLYIQIGQVTAR